jgi:D-arabinose 1-dehydrogenase-like Zn-dependent alcohol dehydrogenase
MRKMKIAPVPRPGADFELQERDILEPPAGHVRIRVQACGICLSDHLVKDGLWPGVSYPRSPGHEVSGTIDEVGPRGHYVEEGPARGSRLAWRA